MRIVSVMPNWDVRRFETIDSTNSWVMAAARNGSPEGLVAVADHQTQGRGRLGRTWEAPAGANLLCTILLRPPFVTHLAAAAVALAGRDAALDVAGISCGLKWPNDLMVGEAYDSKLAGVLAETDGAGAVAVGIGMNVAWAPAGAACLGEGVSREGVLASLLAALDRWLGAGWPAIALAYREACVTIGRPVRVDFVAGEFLEGIAVDVDDEGKLVVQSDGVLRAIEVGDVVHLR